MSAATRSKFTKQLDDIEEYLRRLTEKCAADVRASGLAATGDKGAAEGVMSGRKNEDRLRNAIEENCLDVMLLQQPLIGEDLRFVSGAFRIVSDLTHIDGMTRDIAFLVEEIPDKASKKLSAEFTEMSECAASMVEQAGAAFAAADVEGAQKVVEEDNRVNELYDEVEKKLVGLIRDGKSSAQYLPELLMVAKYFERIGDLAKRVGAWAIFRVTGEHVVAEKASQQRAER
ncbi:phosphate transport system regulatory protein PhoU [Olsenella uli]|uniref:phosphate signaling complex PhoU family protein n=1 Tax=Olsenella uli TaxID=133926 RepID=UPI0019572A07|nr:PhoU domain-containing protein [Olsenella uli]MBM6675338.1 phosphate transport system regulatory protein PhoU [Olsenella uli]